MTGPDELPPNARRWLDSVRNADDPAPADRARIDVAMSKRLQALGIAAPLMPQPLSTPPAASAAAGASAGASAGVNAGGAVAASTSTGAGASVAAHGAAATYAGLSLSGKVALACVSAGIAVAASHFAFTRAPAPASVPAARALPHALEVSPAPTPGRADTAPNAALQRAASPPEPANVRSLPAARLDSEASAKRRTSTSARPTPIAATPPAPAADTLREEVALIESANEALRDHRYASALHLLDAHQSRFANGTLGEERRGLRVLALCGLGELSAGRIQREHFLRDAPHSVLAGKVEAACAAEGDTAQPREGSNP